MLVSCFYSYSSLFFILVCMLTRISRYVISIYSYSCLILISFLFFVTFLILRCFVSFSLFLAFVLLLIHTKSYFNMKYHQSTNTKYEAESMKTNTSCMNVVLYYDVRRRYNRYNDFFHLRKYAGNCFLRMMIPCPM